jgi:hypothetical protein
MDRAGPPSDREAILSRGHLIGGVIPFASIRYLLWGSDSASKTDLGAIDSKSKTIY